MTRSGCQPATRASRSGRVAWIDAAKAIGICLVVYGHVARGTVAALGGSPPPALATADSVIYSFHMPLFFWLAGLLAVPSSMRRGASGLIADKLVTIGAPYLVWSLAQGLLEVWAGEFTNGSVRYADVFAVLWSPRAQFWFLYVLFLCFCLLAIARHALPRHGVIVLSVAALVLYLGHDSWHGLWILPPLARSLVYFCLGALCGPLLARDRAAPGPATLLLAMATFAAAQFAYHEFFGLRGDDYGSAALLLGSLSIASVVIAARCLIGLAPRALAVVGEASMAIYVMHVIVAAGLRVFLTRVAGIDSYAINLVLGVAAGVAVPLLVCRLAEGGHWRGLPGAALGIGRRAAAR
ncbi:MAG: acyltransferase [Rhodocyclaceae bacterium]|nr:acyltransferase [Rhodocyclaceae bacterium]